MPLYRSWMSREEKRWLIRALRRNEFSMQRQYSTSGEPTVMLTKRVSRGAGSDGADCGKLCQPKGFTYTCGKRNGHKGNCDD